MKNMRIVLEGFSKFQYQVVESEAIMIKGILAFIFLNYKLAAESLCIFRFSYTVRKEALMSSCFVPKTTTWIPSTKQKCSSSAQSGQQKVMWLG